MFKPDFVTLIVSLGAVTTAITQTIKKWTGIKGTLALALSFIVSIITTIIHIFSSDSTLNTVEIITLIIFVFLQANGFYHLVPYEIEKAIEKLKNNNLEKS